MKKHASVALLVALSGSLATEALAQTNAEVNSGIQFNFSTPGARSLGMGGAFLALADDATAAYTNPAGLTALRRQEVSLEGRNWDFTNTYVNDGHEGTASGIGVDTTSGIGTAETDSDTTGASFLSYVFPREKFSLAGYRHELAKFESDFNTQGAFVDDPTGALCGDPICRFFPVIADMDLDIVNYGVSAAVQLGSLSIGLGGSYYHFDIDSTTRRFDFTNTDPLGAGGFFGPPNYGDTNVVNYQTQEGRDKDFALNFGLKWQLNQFWSFGAVYRQGPEFEFDARNVSGPSRGVPGIVFVDEKATFHVPDVFGAGIAFKATDALTLAFDVQTVKYSQMTDDFLIIIGLDPADAANFEIDDATEFHLGLEYIIVNMEYPLAVRAGAWQDPDHKLGYDGPDIANSTLFREGDDEIHYSFGAGLIFGKNFQLDGAYDFSDTIKAASLSFVARF